MNWSTEDYMEFGVIRRTQKDLLTRVTHIKNQGYEYYLHWAIRIQTG